MELIKKQETGLSQRHGNSQIDQAIQANGFKKIGSCTDDEILRVIRYDMVLLGMTEKDALNQIEESVLMEFIREEYGSRFTSQDLRLAFRWAMSGKTDVDKSFYGKRFSVAYLSNFMEAYELKKKEMIELDKRLNKPTLQLVEDSRSLEEKLKARYEIFEKYALQHRKLPPMIDILPSFNYLEMIGKLDLSKSNIDMNQREAEAEMKRDVEVARLKMNDPFRVRELSKKAEDIYEIDLLTKKKFVEKYLLSLIA